MGEEPSLETFRTDLADQGVELDQIGVIVLEERRIS